MSAFTSNFTIHRLSYYISMLLAFCIPLYRWLVPYLAFLLLVVWIAEGDIAYKLRTMWGRKTLVFMIGLFVMYSVSLIYSGDRENGLEILQGKFSLLVYPLLIVTVKNFHVHRFRHLLWSFVAGNFAAAIICFFIALFHSFSLAGGEFVFEPAVIPGNYSFFESVAYGGNYFFYKDFSYFHHPSYFAMYTTFSLAILLNELNRLLSDGNRLRNHLGYVFLIIFFLAILFLLNSRAGIIAGSVVFIVSFFQFMFTRSKVTLIALSLVFLTGIALMFLYSQRFRTMFNVLSKMENVKHEKADGVALRLFVWESAWELIKQEPVLGYGVGGARKKLVAKYNEKNLVKASQRNLNAHNQFLETWLSAGIFGVLSLFLLFLIPFIMAIKRREVLVVQFLLITGINFFFESVLCLQAGVQFFAFFLALMVMVVNRNEIRNS